MTLEQQLQAQDERIRQKEKELELVFRQDHENKLRYLTTYPEARQDHLIKQQKEQEQQKRDELQHARNKIELYRQLYQMEQEAEQNKLRIAKEQDELECSKAQFKVQMAKEQDELERSKAQFKIHLDRERQQLDLDRDRFYNAEARANKEQDYDFRLKVSELQLRTNDNKQESRHKEKTLQMELNLKRVEYELAAIKLMDSSLQQKAVDDVLKKMQARMDGAERLSETDDDDSYGSSDKNKRRTYVDEDGNAHYMTEEEIADMNIYMGLTHPLERAYMEYDEEDISDMVLNYKEKKAKGK